jgi:beta-ribofuranosylaminobenzene 5'-phosphate synthase
VAIPNVRKGAYGDEEVSIFQKHTPIPKEEVNEVSHQILMKIIPGIIKKDLTCFGEGLKKVQSIGFKKREIQLQDPVVKNLLSFMGDYGVKAYGMSSFGPSVVGITESDSEAKDLLRAVKNQLKGVGGHFYLSKPNNTGVRIENID